MLFVVKHHFRQNVQNELYINFENDTDIIKLCDEYIAPVIN